MPPARHGGILRRARPPRSSARDESDHRSSPCGVAGIHSWTGADLEDPGVLAGAVSFLLQGEGDVDRNPRAGGAPCERFANADHVDPPSAARLHRLKPQPPAGPIHTEDKLGAAV